MILSWFANKAIDGWNVSLPSVAQPSWKADGDLAWLLAMLLPKNILLKFSATELARVIDVAEGEMFLLQLPAQDLRKAFRLNFLAEV